MTAAIGERVTVIVPTYNEEQFIEDCLLSVVADDSVEVLVIDGGSTDGTREVVRRLMTRLPGLRLVDNPRRTAAAAMNIGLSLATGDIVVRLDAHSIYPAGYLRRLTAALREHDADVAGGVCVAEPRRATVFGRAIAASLTNPWVMGNAAFRRGGGEVRCVDTVPFGCWRAETLRRAGGYNEELTRSQDFDLSKRMAALGARIILIPDVVIRYRARSGGWENVRYNFLNGYWVGYPMVAAGVRFAIRHLVPAFACLIGLGLLAGMTVWPWLPLLAAPYAAVLVLSAVAAAGHGWAVALCLPFVTAGTHLLYGLGTWYGVAHGVTVRLRRSGAPGRRTGTPQRVAQ